MEPTATEQRAEIVLPCNDIEATLPFYLNQLGFELQSIYPADAPRVAVLEGHGIRLCLERGFQGAAGKLRIHGGKSRTRLIAPNGTEVEIQPDVDLVLPPPAPTFQISYQEATAWSEGRAGMHYRDLVPDRQGGRFIASHIRIPEGGPVPDYVHYHKVRFQVIYCYKGWVRVVYEDQGEPFVMRAGDCVLQPPQIRHRVLEASPGLEVIELGCPAEHETHAEHRLTLPTGTIEPDRDFHGQRFIYHQAAKAHWQSFSDTDIETRDTGIARATDGLATVEVLRATKGCAMRKEGHRSEFQFYFVLNGSGSLDIAGREYELTAGAAITLPSETAYSLSCSDGWELLNVALPAGS